MTPLDLVDCDWPALGLILQITDFVITQTETWISVGIPEEALPEQGWKLHVSASPESANEVLKRCLPVLIDGNCSFKFARSPQALEGLSSMDGGIQTGKFLTVYPPQDSDALDFAEKLDRATQGLQGPLIRSDRRMRPDSIVSYRYGGFGSRRLRTASGSIVPALVNPDGELVPDRRSGFVVPSWVDNPFGAESSSPPIIGGRFMRIQRIHRSTTGGVWLAADIETGRRCALKSGLVSAIRHEYETLTSLAGTVAPEPFWLGNEGQITYLASEWLEGETLSSLVMRASATGKLLDSRRVEELAEEMALAVGAIHERGFLLHDLKATNVMIEPTGRVRLVDFETCCAIGTSPNVTGGTRGYLSPERVAGCSAGVQDDIYAIGALLYLLATGAEPSYAPDLSNLLTRPVELLNPQCSLRIVEVIRRCLAAPSERYRTAKEVADTLRTRPAMLHRARDSSQARNDKKRACSPLLSSRGTRDLSPLQAALEMRSTLVNAARWNGEKGSPWTAHLPGRSDPGMCDWNRGRPLPQSRDINSGLAGTVLALAELCDHSPDEAALRTLGGAARALAQSDHDKDTYSPGLYIGECGIGLALITAGKVLQGSEWGAKGTEIIRSALLRPPTSPDLFGGAAGMIRAALNCYQVSGDEHFLTRAIELGDDLLAQSTPEGYWMIPCGWETIHFEAQLGYAHGAAGIGDVLLELARASGIQRFATAAEKTADWIVSHATRAEAISWPVSPGGPSTAAFWCHGASGIGTFLNRIWPDHELIPLIAETLSRSTRWGSPIRCHGLAGNIEFLLDAGQLDQAMDLGAVLLTWLKPTPHGLACASDSPEIISPDYMTGYAGVASTLLRLSRNQHSPRSLEGAP